MDSISPRILLVEDDPDQRELVAEALDEHWPGATITCLGSGAETRRVRADDYDVALLDYNLPDCCGLELLHVLLRTSPDMPVIMLTGERTDRSAVESIQAGASDYLVKHGDYLMVLPPVIEKNLAMARIKAQNRRLQAQIEQRNQELAEINAQLAERNDQLREMAALDPLTGLFNRRHFSEVLRQMFAEAERYDNDVACIMMDVDNFKQVNDTLGHQVGDRLLIAAGSAVRQCVRAADVAARYGGDEFVALLPLNSSEAAASLAERIAQTFTAMLRDEPDAVRQTSMSFGIAGRASHHPTTGDELVAMADHALYQAKAHGKNAVIIDDPVRAR